VVRRALVVNAHDFGQSPGVNRGVVRAHEEGIVTSTSLMVRHRAAGEMPCGRPVVVQDRGFSRWMSLPLAMTGRGARLISRLYCRSSSERSGGK
jgi:hypothetical protein